MCVDALKRAGLALLALSMVYLQPPLSAAQTAGMRVVWVGPNAALSGAAQKAFEPTQIELIAGADALRVAQLGAAFDPGRFARDHAASAVVWTADDAELYVYDTQLDGIVGTRALPKAPLDAATAAAIVLSVKTYLGNQVPADRAAVSLPERRPAEMSFASEGASSEPSVESAGRVPTEELRSTQERLAPVGAHVQRDSHAGAGPRTHGKRSSWRLELAANGGMRVAMHELGPEVRYGLSLQLAAADAAWGVMLDLSAGSGFRTQRSELHEPAAALLGVWNVLHASRWRVACVAGPALHWLLIDVESAHSAQRLRPHLYAGLRLSWHAPAGWFVGAAVNADIPLLSQRYWVDQQLAMEATIPGVTAMFSAGAPIVF